MQNLQKFVAVILSVAIVLLILTWAITIVFEISFTKSFAMLILLFTVALVFLAGQGLF